MMRLTEERVGSRSFDRDRADFAGGGVRDMSVESAGLTPGQELLGGGLRRSLGGAEGENERRSAENSNFTHEDLHFEDLRLQGSLRREGVWCAFAFEGGFSRPGFRRGREGEARSATAMRIGRVGGRNVRRQGVERACLSAAP